MSYATHSRSTWKIWVLGAVMAVIISVMLLILAGVFHRKVPGVAGESKGRSAAGLETATARIVQQPRYETATGSVQPVHEAAVASRLLSKVLEISVTAGQAVEKDQILVRLDDADLQARVKQAEAALSQAETAKEKAIADFERAQQLQSKKAISQAEFDAAQSANKAVDAAIDQATQAVREAQVMLDRATIRSPLDGLVVDKKVEAGDTVGPGQVLLTLFDPTHMQMVASVRESLALKLEPGQHIPTRLDALDLNCEATISEIVPQSDVATRSFTVKVTGPCPPGAYSGMFGRLLLPQGDEDVLVVPSKAIIRVGQLTMVDLVENDLVIRRNVRIGRSIENDVEILAGLQDGDKLVLR